MPVGPDDAPGRVPDDPLVVRVPLERLAAGGADEAFHVEAREPRLGRRARRVRDRLLGHGPDEVVGAEVERDRRELLADLDPVRLDVVDVVEEEARGRDDAQVEEAARGGEVRERRPVGVEGERDEAEEALRLVLQLADPHEVVDALLVGLDRAVEHRDVRPDAVHVAEARDLEPPLAVDLVRADDVADPLREDLGPAAGAGVHPGVLQLEDRLDERPSSRRGRSSRARPSSTP